MQRLETNDLVLTQREKTHRRNNRFQMFSSYRRWMDGCFLPICCNKWLVWAQMNFSAAHGFCCVSFFCSLAKPSGHEPKPTIRRFTQLFIHSTFHFCSDERLIFFLYIAERFANSIQFPLTVLLFFFSFIYSLQLILMAFFFSNRCSNHLNFTTSANGKQSLHYNCDCMVKGWTTG